MDDEPLLAVDEDFEAEEWDIELEDAIASNDQWVFEEADRLVSQLKGRIGKDRRTEGEVFDRQTLMVLHKFLAHGVLKSLDYPISTGKEANVFRGTTPLDEPVAVKIYRVNTATFKHVLKYIQGDERFEGVGGDKRTLVHAWCQKEYRNLLRLQDAGCTVPEAIRSFQNVLVTEFLGNEDGAWPRLQDVGRLEDPERHLDLLIDDYGKALREANLVHADLSAFNILVQDVDKKAKLWKPRMIDVGQAVLRTHPMAHEFLQRDIKNLAGFFRRQGAKTSPEDVKQRLEATL